MKRRGGIGISPLDNQPHLDDGQVGPVIRSLVNQTIMTTTLQIDSYHYKCKSCYKLHSGPTRILDFQCVKEQMVEHGLERIYEGNFSAVCDCDQPIKITFRVRECPEGILSYLGYRSADAEIIIEPKVREHSALVY